MARPSIKIDNDLCLKAESLAAQGLTADQIASVLGMGESTLYEKQKQYPEFSEAIKKGRSKGIATITNTLFNKAKSGDNTAMIFYLKNRAGWKDKVETEHTGEIGQNLNYIVRLPIIPEDSESWADQYTPAKLDS
jgi:hypothetical protein|tara:strand:+ start:664 stop:1068 length:405 start_codon:yes stop_codon:yes gene_type:complete